MGYALNTDEVWIYPTNSWEVTFSGVEGVLLDENSFIGETSITISGFLPVYQTISGTYEIATCDDESKADVIAIADGIPTISGGETALLKLHGKISNSAWNWEYGKSIYLSISGTFAQDPPTISGYVAKPLGVVLSPTTMFFNPQVGWVIEEDV